MNNVIRHFLNPSLIRSFAGAVALAICVSVARAAEPAGEFSNGRIDLGIVVKNAIVLIDRINQLREEGVPKRAAIAQAAEARLRPIIMTTVCTLLGFAPLAFGGGDGAEVRAPMAITVIGGLAVSTLLTLVVIPIVYDLMDRRSDASYRERAAKARELHQAAIESPL